MAEPGLYLQERHLQEVRRLIGVHLPMAEIWAFGSRVSGGAHEASDLDLVARVCEDAPGRPVSALREAFRDSNLPIAVDLLAWEEMPNAFREEVERLHIVIPPLAESPGPAQSSRLSAG